MDTTLIFSVIAVIVIIGFAGEFFFKKTGIPIFIFLILIGIVLGPVLGVFPREELISGLSLFAVFTLIMVLFYNGLNMKSDSILSNGGRALIQVVIYVLASITIIGLVVSFFLNWGIVSSLIFASMIGGETTAAVVIPLSQSLKLRQETIAFLTLESAASSIFCIVLFFAFVSVNSTGSVLGDLIGTASQFFLGLAIGAVLSVVWIFVLHHFRRQKFIYVLTLGLVLMTYSITSTVGGNGQLAVLIFGIILANYSIINKVAVNAQLNIDPLKRRLRKFHEEMSFLMETLFFVFLGLTFSLATHGLVDSLIIGLLLLGVLVAMRVVATSISTYNSELSKEKPEIILMCAQGLTPATLAILAVNLQIPHANSSLNMVTYIIILTNVVAAIGSVAARHRKKLKFGEFRQNLEENPMNHG